ncbi:MAG: DNA (cytosine-5-)-methyltransferase [Flavobacteriales bacterium]
MAKGEKRPLKTPNVLRVAELFAGVGGFRLGLEAANRKSKGPRFAVVWSNQWEPSTKAQHASMIYEARFGQAGHSSADIGTVRAEEIPDHDLLVGGFPCQDYSVASTLKASKGLVGKKGVLWWQIHRILRDKEKPPPYLLLENVDRLLGSPAGQRGRDMAVMLRSLCDLGYAVEWRVVNAADYGMPQRRKRTFILGIHRSSALHERCRELVGAATFSDGLIQGAFPITAAAPEWSFQLEKRIAVLSSNFNKEGGKSPFGNCGVMCDGMVRTGRVTALYLGKRTTLGDILRPSAEVAREFFIAKADLPAWKKVKSAKREQRMSPSTGHKYYYSEGSMAFPDHLDRPARTIVTGEGGRTPSRFKHVVRTTEGKYRRLVPEELEALNMFPSGHTRGVPDARRAFFMGNALVTGVVERIARVLATEVGKR